MSSVYSSTSTTSTTSLSSTLKGYGGLASGLDRDTLIEEFTVGTRTEIATQKQKKEKLEWTQTAIQNITDKIYDFTNTYTSYTSASNLTSTKLFTRSVITASGENSSCVSVSGTASAADNISVSRIKQLATSATLNSGVVSNQALTTASITGDADGKLTGTKEVSTIEGDLLYIKYGSTTYSVTMKDGGDSLADTVDMLNAQLAKTEITGDQTLSDVMKAELSADGKITFTAIDNAHGNRLELAGGTGNILQDLGFLKEGQTVSSLSDAEKSIVKTGSLTATYDAAVTQESSISDLFSGASLTFSYNGTQSTITTGDFDENSTIADVQADLQAKLDQAFGTGRVKVDIADADGGKALSFKTMIPATSTSEAKEDTTSTISFLGGDNFVGTGGLFGLVSGSSNRINLSGTLDQAGFAADADFDKSLQDDGSYYMSINGVKIEGITKDSTISEIVDLINNSDAGVTVSYQTLSDQFVITSNESGAGGKIVFDTSDDGTVNLAETMFKTTTCQEKEGQDAILSVKYPNSDKEIEITRGSNTIDLDGISVTLKSAFGYDEDGNAIEGTEAITFTGSVDTEKTVSIVKAMIDSYNELIDLINTEVSTKPDSDYQPLTDDQKEEMTESQIEKWETKAKAGLLFGDTDLRMMADSLRSVASYTGLSALSAIGISVSDDYSDNGKLVFDEDAFTAALEEDPENVRILLNGNTATNGTTGLLTRISTVMERYGGTTGATKGILVTRAGSSHAPTTVLSNSIQTQMDLIDDVIDRLNDRLESEQDRYITQFTNLETLISEMNSQSSYLSSMFSY